MTRSIVNLILATLLLSASQAALAHKPSDSYLRLQVQDDTIQGRWDIALRDLHERVDLDLDGNGAVTWEEVRSSRARIEALVLPQLTLSNGDGNCPMQSETLRIAEHTDGHYAALDFQATCTTPIERLSVRYGLLFDIDPSHRGLLSLEMGGRTHSGIFRPASREVTVSIEQPAMGTLFFTYLQQGAWHIWSGFDHLLFLFCLLLPAVLQRTRDGWVPAASARSASLDLLRVITAFTLAHALSLSAAAVDWLQLPSRWVESAVAATIIFAALNNLLPLVQRRLWMVAFFFGLIHGAGYAGVLAGLGFSPGTLAMALLGFNLGVEGGQIVLALLCVPLAWLARNHAVYRHVVVAPGSLLAMLLGLWWLVQRLFHIQLEALL